MATSVFFNNFNSLAEKSLLEDLVIESIRIYGHDVFYCPRTIVARDDIFNEDALSTYNHAYFVEMYLKNVEGFEGEGDFLSKFDIQVRDQYTFVIARKVFNDEVGVHAQFDRPREGDLIYFPLTGKIYVTMFVEHEAVFYQLGGLYFYELRCELFEYGNEILNTGVEAIDTLGTQYSIEVGDAASRDANGNIIIDETTGQPTITGDYNLDSAADNDEFETIANNFIDWSETNPFGEP